MPGPDISEILRQSAFAGTGKLRTVLERIPRQARIVLIGEASHGTHEFYQMRAEITKLLIQERGFSAIVTEADFPDAFRVNKYVLGLSKDRTATQALSDYKAVISFLEKEDPRLAERARHRYSCFDRFGADATTYGLRLAMGSVGCEKEAVKQLAEVQQKLVSAERLLVFKRFWESMPALQYFCLLMYMYWKVQADVDLDVEADEPRRRHEELFAALVNAEVVKGAESYYRKMFFRDELTWNIRDQAMVRTIGHLEDHLRRVGGSGCAQPRIVVWAHNSHLGDANYIHREPIASLTSEMWVTRATDMGKQRGEVNVGQLCREKFGVDQVYSIGFTTHTGTVAAADEWDEPGQVKCVRPSMPGSYEHVLHQVGLPEYGLDLRVASQELLDVLRGPKLERAIGVIYRPDTERYSHYFHAWLPDQFDMVLHIDVSSAVIPLDPSPMASRMDAPKSYEFEECETFPSAV